ncbi:MULTISPECIES: hypothetical protein [unclassified Mesorhizobium]|nr:MULTISPECIES: hypothetical protein [unclassified Mesorhizobium]
MIHLSAHERVAFSPQETIARLGVEADIASYHRLPKVKGLSQHSGA